MYIATLLNPVINSITFFFSFDLFGLSEIITASNVLHLLSQYLYIAFVSCLITLARTQEDYQRIAVGPSIIHLRIFVCWDPHFFWEIPPPPLSTCNSATIVSHSTQLFWYRAELMVQIWPNCFPGQDNCYKDGGEKKKGKKNLHRAQRLSPCFLFGARKKWRGSYLLAYRVGKIGVKAADVQTKINFNFVHMEIPHT